MMPPRPSPLVTKLQGSCQTAFKRCTQGCQVWLWHVWHEVSKGPEKKNCVPSHIPNRIGRCFSQISAISTIFCRSKYNHKRSLGAQNVCFNFVLRNTFFVSHKYKRGGGSGRGVSSCSSRSNKFIFLCLIIISTVMMIIKPSVRVHLICD